MTAKVFTIPPGIPFARALAEEILLRANGKHEDLAKGRILLPTRRACRALRDAFLQLNDGQPLLLPRMQPLGDVDEEELVLELAGQETVQAILDIPPSLPPLRRQILLARALLQRPDFKQDPAHALKLAGTLGRLMDRIYTENLKLADLPKLVDGEFAAHWQITLDFLTILSKEWPAILKTLGVIDAADRRNRLINTLADHWSKNPPSYPVIAAGSTGSIPATANLLRVVANLPTGCIVLPGLDQDMDEESWLSLEDSHPQATLRNLLQNIDIERKNVKLWPIKIPDKAAPRRLLATELMRPAATSDQWSQLRHQAQHKKTIGEALEGLQRLDSDTPQEEARSISLLLREALETPNATAVLVTPDRDLARRVASLCCRWDLNLDDSSGVPLPQTSAGLFIALTAQACLQHFSPGSLLALLRHDLCSLAPASSISRLEIKILRGPRPPAGFEGLRNRLAERKGDDRITELLDSLAAATAPFTKLMLRDGAPFADWLDAHIAITESLSSDRLWTGQDGEEAAEFLAELRTHAAAFLPVNGADYAALLQTLLQAVVVRPAWGTHPRLSILGQLEARMLQADLVILGGLNEGFWPPDPGHDPWMSRSMMKTFGLPPPERSIGLAAHDFVQGFCAPRVVLTRSKRVEGAPSVPARWLQRLDTVLEAAGFKPESLQQKSAATLALARHLDRNAQQKSFDRPAPRPPVALRPRTLSVTRIETWLNDPYSLYASHVLRLRKLDPLEKLPDAVARGTLLHDVMKNFVAATKTGMPAPEKALGLLLDLGQQELAKRADDPGFWDFWWPRFERIAAWAVDHEFEWREQARPAETEIKGSMTLPGPASPFVLTARADRIDTLKAGGAAVIDYKSTSSFSAGQIKSGKAPQLALEALILQAGGFENMAAAKPELLSYWIMTGGRPAGDEESLSKGLEDILSRTREGLESLIALYDQPDTPYYSLPDPARVPRYNDYIHLARVQEWAALDEDAEDAA